MSQRTAFAVDQNFHQESVFFKDGDKSGEVLVSSTIHTSEFLVLTKDTAYDPKAAGVCVVAETADHTIYGDVVRICGPIACPGRSVKIVCRTLEFYPDSRARSASIIVDGASGEQGDVVRAQPSKGKDGATYGEFGQAGEAGKPGSDGKAPGVDGGSIQLLCAGLSVQSDVVLSAKGGMGGGGSNGTNGGTGGRGHDGFRRTMEDMRHLVETAGEGGRGGHGGPGGAGNNGGQGGSITVHYGGSIPTDRKFSLSVGGGDGGPGGQGGNGGQGGDTGRGYRYDFALFGGGPAGCAGPGGKGGFGGKGGRITIANAAADAAGLTLDFAHGKQGGEGQPGKVGTAGAAEPDRHVMDRVQTWGDMVGADDAPPQPRALPATVSADSKTDGAVGRATFHLKGLRRHVAFSQLRMLLERLRFLFLRLGRANLNLDPTQQNADYMELLAGLQWIQDVLGAQENQLDAAVRDSLDDTIFFFRRGAGLKYELATRKPLPGSPGVGGEDWPDLWEDRKFDTATLGHYLQDSGKNGGRVVFFRSDEVMFHSRRELPAVTLSWKKILRDRCRPLSDGFDLAVNVTDDGGRGLIFKDDQYYRYTLDRLVFGIAEKLSAIEGPYSISKDYPGLWSTNVTAAFAGQPDRIYVFQKTGTFDLEYKFHPPQYMLYDLAAKTIVSGYPKNIADDWPGLIEEEASLSTADRSMAVALWMRANDLLRNLRLERDYFGNVSNYTILETHDYFETAKTKALGHLNSAETEYREYQHAMNVATERTAGLQLAVNVESSRYDALQTEVKSALADSNDAFAEIDRLRNALDAKYKALDKAATTLKDAIWRDWGVSWQDMFGCLTQLSFMHWTNVPEAPDSGPGLMAISQAGDMLHKGMSNVVTDSGQSMAKAYVVKRVDTLGKEIRSLKALTVTRSQFIDPTSLYNDAYKLNLTRDQFADLCNEFVGRFPAAKEIIDDLDDYVSLADQRNAAILEYNRLWQRVYDLQAESAKCRLDFQHAQSSLAGHAQPYLPVFTSFATERYNRAKDQTLSIFYLASRAYIMKSLQLRNMFSEMLRYLPAAGQIDSATFTQDSLETLYNQVMDELKGSSPPGPATAAVVFQKSTHADMFDSIARDGVATFDVAKATAKTTKGPFAHMANVRLTMVRCWAGGLETSKKHHFRLVHSGHETFVSAAGKELTVDHEPSTLSYAFGCKTAIDPTAEEFAFQGTEEPKPLAGTKFALLGPFTTWYILFDDKDDRAKATSLRVEFDVVYEGFDAHLGGMGAPGAQPA